MTQKHAPDIAEAISPVGSPDLTMGSPAIYKIRVRGNLADSWSEKLGGLQIVATAAKGTTVITGSLPDQAALSGVLNTLYELQLPVVSVEHLPYST